MKNIDTNLMKENIDNIYSLMKVLANKDRLLLLCEINKEEKTVGQLEAILDIEQPTLSQQLGVLRTEGMVSTRRDGKNIYYKLSNQKAKVVMQSVFKQFCEESKNKEKKNDSTKW